MHWLEVEIFLPFLLFKRVHKLFAPRFKRWINFISILCLALKWIWFLFDYQASVLVKIWLILCELNACHKLHPQELIKRRFVHFDARLFTGKSHRCKIFILRISQNVFAHNLLNILCLNFSLDATRFYLFTRYVSCNYM